MHEKNRAGEVGCPIQTRRDCNIHGLSRSPFRSMALSPQAFEGLPGGYKKLRNMQSPSRAVATFAFAIFVASCVLLAGVCVAESFDTAKGIFVSYGVNQSGALITIQQSDRLMVYVVASDVGVRERSGDEEWQTTVLGQIAQGEPVTLRLDPAGYVRQIDAEYSTVTTRLITQKNGYLVTTSGQAYKLVGRAAQVQPTWDLGTFLKLRVDSKSNTAFDVTASSQPFAGGPLAQPIQVTIVVTVPLNTPARDIVYIATDAADWVPNGLRMSPLTGNRWTTTLALGKGSSLKYKFTRGSWATAETNQSGIEIPNRSLTITKTGDTQQVQDAVVRWSDLPS
jgi:hypothetical protein